MAEINMKEIKDPEIDIPPPQYTQNAPPPQYTQNGSPQYIQNNGQQQQYIQNPYGSPPQMNPYGTLNGSSSLQAYPSQSYIAPPPIVVQQQQPVVSTEKKPIASGPWKHEFCGCCDGGCGICMYAFCCPQCAVASARSKYDGSNWCLNFCCISTGVTRNVIRQGYNIKGNCCGDVCAGAFCTCCVAAQLYQETKSRGPLITRMA